MRAFSFAKTVLFIYNSIVDSLIAIFYYFLIMESFNQENHGSDNFYGADSFRMADNLPLWSEP